MLAALLMNLSMLGPGPTPPTPPSPGTGGGGGYTGGTYFDDDEEKRERRKRQILDEDKFMVEFLRTATDIINNQ